MKLLSALTIGTACLVNSANANVIDEPLPDISEGCN